MAGGGRRFEFGWLEVLGLILAFAGGSAVVFFLGIFVGKGLQESRVRSEEHVVRLPIDGPAQAKVRSTSKPTVTESLSKVMPKPTSVLRLAIKPAPTATRVPRVAPTRIPPRVIATAAPVPVRTKVPVRSTPTRMPTPTPFAAVVAEGTWAVQVNATKDPATADRLIRQLVAKGYPAYLFQVRLRGENWYRVRIGRFVTMEQATSMVVRLKNKERYRRAFLVEE